MTPIAHGVAGWSLEDMDWDPSTGVAVFTYSHAQLGTREVTRAQPCHPSHAGWDDRMN